MFRVRPAVSCLPVWQYFLSPFESSFARSFSFASLLSSLLLEALGPALSPWICVRHVTPLILVVMTFTAEITC